MSTKMKRIFKKKRRMMEAIGAVCYLECSALTQKGTHELKKN